MASSVVDLVKINVTSLGTGALTLGAAVPGYRGVEVLTSGNSYGYSIQQGNNFEFGRGTYLAASNQLIRSPIGSSLGGTAINLAPNAQVAFVVLASDLNPVQLTADAQAAAITATTKAAQTALDAATVSAGVNNLVNGQRVFPFAYASALPQGVTSLSTAGVGTGAAGTAGTYAGGVSGGPTGFTWQYTIDGTGKIGSYSIVSKGLSTATTAPTLTYPSGGVTGATVPVATVSGIVLLSETYWAATSDSKGVALWQNTGTGSPVAVTNPDATQIVFYNKAAVDAAVASVSGVATFSTALGSESVVTLARPTVSSTGTLVGNFTNTLLFMTPIAATPGAHIKALRFVCQNATIPWVLTRYTAANLNNGTVPVEIASYQIQPTGTTNALTVADFGFIPVNTGEYIAFRPTAGNGVRVESATIDAPGWLEIVSGAFVTGTISVGWQIQFGIDIASGAYSPTYNTVQAVPAVQAAAAALANNAARAIVGETKPPYVITASSAGILAIAGLCATLPNTPGAVFDGVEWQCLATPGAIINVTVCAVRLSQKADVARSYTVSGMVAAQTMQITPAMVPGFFLLPGEALWLQNSQVGADGIAAVVPWNHIAATAGTLGAAVTATNLKIRWFYRFTQQTVTAAAQAVTTSQIAASANKIVSRALTGGAPAKASTNAIWHMLLVGGQSLAAGSDKLITSVAPRSTNFTFGSGPSANTSGNAYGGTLTTPGTSTAIALAEQGSETICTQLAFVTGNLDTIDNGTDPATRVYFAADCAKSGYGLSQLNKGSTWYACLIDQVTTAKARAVAAGKTLKVVSMHWLQGQTDALNGVTRAAYVALLNQYITDINTDLKAITGQTEPIYLGIYQMACGYTSLANSNAIQLALMDVAQGNALAFYAGPIHHLLPHQYDGIHLTGEGEIRAANQGGRALKQLQIDQVVPHYIRPISATALGTLIRLKLEVPTLPLRFDELNIGVVQDNGFKISDGTGTLTLSNIQIVGDTVYITINRTLGTSPVINHALDYLGTLTRGTFAACGNLRDSSYQPTTIGGVTYDDGHVFGSFQLPIQVLG